MTIRSMPNNKNWYDNYDEIFKKEKVENFQDVEVSGCFREDLWLRLIREPQGEHIVYSWEQIPRTTCFDCNIPADVYVLSQDHQLGVGYTLQMAYTHAGALHDYALDELRDALDYCSNYEGRHTK